MCKRERGNEARLCSVDGEEVDIRAPYRAVHCIG